MRPVKTLIGQRMHACAGRPVSPLDLKNHNCCYQPTSQTANADLGHHGLNNGIRYVIPCDGLISDFLVKDLLKFSKVSHGLFFILQTRIIVLLTIPRKSDKSVCHSTKCS